MIKHIFLFCFLWLHPLPSFSRARLRFQSLRQRWYMPRGPHRLRVPVSAGLGGSDLCQQWVAELLSVTSTSPLSFPLICRRDIILPLFPGKHSFAMFTNLARSCSASTKRQSWMPWLIEKETSFLISRDPPRTTNLLSPSCPLSLWPYSTN